MARMTVEQARLVRRSLGGAAALMMCAASGFAQELIPATSGAWTTFAARPASAPVAVSSGTPYTLEIRGNGTREVYGGWRTRVAGLTGGQYYRFRARAVTSAVASPRESVTILLRWRGQYGDEVAPDYVWEYRTQTDGSLLFDRTVQAPPRTSALDVELVLQWSANGHVRFDGISLTAGAPPAPRPVTVAAVSYRPSATRSGLDSVQRAAQHGEGVARAQHPDVMVFGELLNVIGAPGSYDVKAEAIPGPSTARMAALARAHRTYVAFGMLERDGGTLYNTAVLIDRSGAIAGKYRKVQLPLSEVSSGIAPGDEVPVFQTDFGKVALLICQDMSFPEPARQAAMAGAEILLVPIWGGKPALVGARAIEQSLYVAASGYDYASEVLDPTGAMLARVAAPGQPGSAVATIDLSRRYREPWIGDWRDTSGKQRRTGPTR